MLAMCVGKTADSTSTPTGYHHQGVSSQKQRWVKNPVVTANSKVLPQAATRSGKYMDDRVRDKDGKEKTIVRDDEEGHLIYKPGDVLDTRCNYKLCLILQRLHCRTTNF